MYLRLAEQNGSRLSHDLCHFALLQTLARVSIGFDCIPNPGNEADCGVCSSQIEVILE
jgi:hypothetical protein